MPQPLTVTLEGRTALVTGGGTGIGKACAGAMARLGAEVTIAGPHAAVLEQAADELSSDGAVRFVQADVTDEDQVAAAVDAAKASFCALSWRSASSLSCRSLAWASASSRS